MPAELAVLLSYGRGEKMKKLFWVSALCLTFAGCASGGDVVGNGLTAGHPMNTMMEDSGGCGCGCHEGTADAGTCTDHKDMNPQGEDCGCGHKEHHHKKKKAK
jgi:hypothetical protein